MDQRIYQIQDLMRSGVKPLDIIIQEELSGHYIVHYDTYMVSYVVMLDIESVRQFMINDGLNVVFTNIDFAETIESFEYLEQNKEEVIIEYLKRETDYRVLELDK